MGKPCRVTFGEKVFFKPDFVKRFLDTLHLEDDVVDNSTYLKSIGYDNAFNEGDPMLIREKKAEAKKEGSVGLGGDVEATAKALEGLDKESISNLEKLSNIYYHGNPTKKVIDKLEDRGNGIHIGTKEQAKEFLNLSGTEGTLYKVKLSAKEIIKGIDEENQANFTQKDVDELVNKYMNNGDNYMIAFNKAQAELRNPFLYKNQIGKADALKYLNTKEGSLSDYSIVTFNPNLTEIVSVVSYDKSGKIIIFDNTTKSIAEAYHKAKADGSNPELVKAVDDLLGKQPQAAAEPNIFDDFDTTNKRTGLKGKVEANKAFREKYGEDAAVAKAISSNFEAIADELKAKGIFTKIKC